MTYSHNRYDQDFKKNAVRLSFNSSKPVKIIASEIGVPESALYRWRKLYTEDGKQTPFASLEAENRALKRENAELALERDMLKKAAAYFASLQKEPRSFLVNHYWQSLDHLSKRNYLKRSS